MSGADSYGCHECEPEKAFDFYARKTLWDKVSAAVRPAQKPKRGRPKAGAHAK